MTLEKIGKFLTTAAGAALLLTNLYMTYMNTLLFPVPLPKMYALEAVLLFGSGVILAMAVKNEMYMANILSAAAVISAVYNTVLLRIFYKFVEPYVNYIMSQPCFYPFTAESAASNYKIFMISVFMILIVFWLRYTVVMKHNMFE